MGRRGRALGKEQDAEHTGRGQARGGGGPGGSEGEESACSAGDLGSIPGSGRPPGEGNGYPLRYSCLENPMAREAWQATIYGVATNQTQLSN